MSAIVDLEAFSKNYLVIGLTPEQIAEIAKLGQIRKYTAQEFVIKSGQKSEELYVLLAGRVIITTAEGDKLAEVGPGSVIGEVSLIDAMPRSADAVCVGLVEAAVFNANELRTYLNAHRELGFVVIVNLARVLSGRLRNANARIDMLSIHAHDAWTQAL